MSLVDAAAAREFADSLPDDPLHFGPRCVLQRGLGRAWLRGPPSAPQAAAVVADWLPTEPDVFGLEPTAIAPLLAEIPGWDCVHVRGPVGAGLAAEIARIQGRAVRRVADLYYRLEQAPPPLGLPSVRRLTPADLPLFERAPAELQPVGFLSLTAALTGGVVAGAVVDDRLVSVAAMTVSSESHADVAVHTLEPWRRRGLARAAASLVVRELFDRGLTPIWSTSEENLASQRVAARLGFQPVGRAEYLVLGAPATADSPFGRPASG